MEYDENESWRLNRDRKLYRMLDPDEPAWLVEEELVPEDEVVHYTIVHRWKPGGWARRRYTYDVVGDVIHFRGSTKVDDGELVRMRPEHRLTHPAAKR